MLTSLRSIIGFNPIRWIRNTIRMRRLVAAFAPGVPQSEGALRCAILVTPWLGTSVPWFSVGIGLLLAREGHNVAFILDDFMFGKNRLRYRFVLACLSAVMHRIGSRHKILIMSKVVASNVLEADSKAQIRSLAELNAVWELRGEIKSAGRAAFVDLCEKQLQVAYNPIKNTVNEHQFEFIFIPGGVWGTSGLWAANARKAGIRIASFDNGGFGSAMIAVNGLACHLQDIPMAFNLIKEEAGQIDGIEYAVSQAQVEMNKRMQKSDKFKYQVTKTQPIGGRYDDAILVALNSSWDSAALGLHAVFDSNSDWIIFTVKYLLEHTNSTVVVRQHPAERLSFARTSDDYRKLLDDNFHSSHRVHFIAAEDEINSYDLIRQVKGVIVHTSTIGIEAAANRKPVITTSNCYYSDLGFVHKAHGLAEYGMLLDAISLGNLKLTDYQQRDALVCYYLTQCCNFIWTSFNPEDFMIWSKLDANDLGEDDGVKIIMKGIINNIPVAYINHASRVGLMSL